MGPEERFVAVADTFAGCPGVTLPGACGRRGFSSSALKVNGSIFAMLTAGRFVVKLSRDRVDALVAGGVGVPLDASGGRPTKEWLTVVGEDEQQWLALAREALDFVGSRPRR